MQKKAILKFTSRLIFSYMVIAVTYIEIFFFKVRVAAVTGVVAVVMEAVAVVTEVAVAVTTLAFHTLETH